MDTWDYGWKSSTLRIRNKKLWLNQNAAKDKGRERTKKSFGVDFLTYILESEYQNFQKAVNSSKGSQSKYDIESGISYMETSDPSCWKQTTRLQMNFQKKMKAYGTIEKNKR